MRYEYGTPITIMAPGGNPVSGQVGKMTAQGPVIHIPSFQVEMPADFLREEGWQVPEFENALAAVEAINYEAAGREIVDAMLNADELEIAKSAVPAGPKRFGTPVRAVGRGPSRPAKLPHCTNCGSFTHTAENCPRQGSAVI